MKPDDTITLKELLAVIDSVRCEDCWGNVKRAFEYSTELKNKLERMDVKKEFFPQKKKTKN